jgi:hypothetical protein
LGLVGNAEICSGSLPRSERLVADILRVASSRAGRGRCLCGKCLLSYRGGRACSGKQSWGP